MIPSITLTPIPHIPHVQPGDNIADLLLAALESAQMPLQANDILVIAQKIVSKAEGRLVDLNTVIPTAKAQEVAAQVSKDPRLVELILQESEEISRIGHKVLIVRHRLGFTSANAGIDRSNVAQSATEDRVLLLPRDPDASAEAIRQTLQAQTKVHLGIIIADSHGRPFRLGTVGVAIGVAGITALWNRRGEPDLYGYTLEHTDVGFADEVAAAAGLVMGQASEGRPVVLVRGLQAPTRTGKATDLIRPKSLDLYR